MANKHPKREPLKMQTRQKVSAQKTPPRTAEVQRQIEDDAKLARRIHMQPRSPTKKKKNNGILRSQITKPSITSRRLALAIKAWD